MRESEALLLLNVSQQTLYRYRKNGKIPYRRVKGPTRPVIEYDPADVERLRQSLEQERNAESKAAVPESTALGLRPQRVTFGLPPSEYEEFVREAARYGMRVGEYARQLVREGMESQFRLEAEQLRGEMRQLKGELQTMRHEFASGFESVLEYSGLTSEEASQWVTDNLR